MSRPTSWIRVAIAAVCASVALEFPIKAAAIECGETKSGSIGSTGEEVVETFTANQSERISATVAAQTSSPIEPEWTLFVVGGAQVAVNASLSPRSGQGESAALPSDHDYEIRITDSGNDETGAFNVTLEAITETFDGASNGPPNPTCALGDDGTQPIDCGQTVLGDIEVPGETDTYSFDARMGDAVSVTIGIVSGAPFEPHAVLFAPDGSQLPLEISGVPDLFGCPGQCESEPFSSDGVYTLKVFDASFDDTGTYALSVEAITETFDGASNGPPNPTCALGDDGTQPIDCGQTVLGDIEVPGETDTFTFKAKAANTVRITTSATAGAASPRAVLFAPDGTEIGLDGILAGCPGECDSAALPSDGVYTIKVFDLGLDDTGSYSVLWQQLVEGQPLCVSVPVLPAPGLVFLAGVVMAAGLWIMRHWPTPSRSPHRDALRPLKTALPRLSPRWPKTRKVLARVPSVEAAALF